MKHVYCATNYKYERLDTNDKTWKPAEPLSLKKGDIVRVFDADTGEQLETERGDRVFELLRDYDGKSRVPYFK